MESDHPRTTASRLDVNYRSKPYTFESNDLSISLEESDFDDVSTATGFMQDDLTILDIELILNCAVENLGRLAFCNATVLGPRRYVCSARLLVLIDIVLVWIRHCGRLAGC